MLGSLPAKITGGDNDMSTDPQETEGGQQHWDRVYGARQEAELTWFEETPSVSYDLVIQYLRPGSGFIDVGGGASRLVDRLLAGGYGPIAVLDISAAALAGSQERLGDQAGQVEWIVADITHCKPTGTWAVWHDRAVFHFLTAPEDREAYLSALDKALQPGGVAIIATFDENGPEKCSGLPVVRYTPDELAKELQRLAPDLLRPVASLRHVHITPKGNRQSFQFSVFQKAGQPG